MIKNYESGLKELAKTAVIDDGIIRDVDMPQICGCDTPSLNWCETHCKRYYGCDNVAFANDILKVYEGVF